MKHELTPGEATLLASLLERFAFEPVIVRLSGTMLEKSIIDARGPVRAMLARSGLVDFSLVGQGPAAKLTLELPFVTGKEADRRAVSFYRPNTKEGDPRFWVSGLRADAKPGEALVLAFSNGSLAHFLLRGEPEHLAAGLANLLPSRFEARGEVEAQVARLSNRLPPPAQWIPTRRAGPTGVGYTLEDYLGIPANSSKAPDLGFAELKAYRKGAQSGPGKLVSLFAKTPNWLGVGKGIGLLKRFGYLDEARNRLALYCTITTAPNSLGWKLELDYDARQVYVVHDHETTLAYDLETLERALERKHPATLFVIAGSRGEGKAEEFLYETVVLCREPSLARFIELIEDGLIGLDFTLHQKPDGRARDHGYLWRIRESAIPRLYAYRRTISPQ